MRKGLSPIFIKESLFLLFEALIFASKYLQLNQIGRWPLSTCLLLSNSSPLITTSENVVPFFPHIPEEGITQGWEYQEVWIIGGHLWEQRAKVKELSFLICFRLSELCDVSLCKVQLGTS